MTGTQCASASVNHDMEDEDDEEDEDSEQSSSKTRKIGDDGKKMFEGCKKQEPEHTSLAFKLAMQGQICAKSI